MEQDDTVIRNRLEQKRGNYSRMVSLFKWSWSSFTGNYNKSLMFSTKIWHIKSHHLLPIFILLVLYSVNGNLTVACEYSKRKKKKKMERKGNLVEDLVGFALNSFFLLSYMFSPILFTLREHRSGAVIVCFK